jgi:O-antigen biosynthesis protein
MQLHADRDVLLLNSDTVVAAGWLDRIAAHANSQLHVASVTPLSNNASIASYPKIVKNNTVHVGDTASIDSLAARVNAGQSVEAPVGVGFCMWIARAALDVVGYFDEEQFGKGYGEEVEWCLRARQLGFKHVLAMDIFVHHAGEVSFGSGASAIRERAQMLVDAAFPSFSSDVQLFLARDTAYEWRRRLVLACDFAGVSHNEKQTVLHINTINGGGVDRFIRDVAAGVTSARHAVMHVGRQCTIVESINAGYVFQVDNVDVQAASILKALRVNMLHVHSTSAAVWNVVVALRRAMPSLGYVLTLHDILFVDDEAFSTETITPCQKTLLRTSQIAIEASATTAPSEFAAKLARQHLNVEPIILPNAIPLESPHALGTMDSVDAESAAFTQVVGDRPVFAVVGAIGPHKGSNVLESIMSQLPEDIFCVIVGYTDARTSPGWISDRLFIHGPYISSQLTALLRAYHARVALFPNRIPESFSYVLSEVWQAGLPALVPSVGALEERVRCWGGGEVFANDAEPADIAHKIKVMVRSPPTQLPPHSPPAIADYTDMTQTLDRLYLKHANEHAWTLSK